MKTCKRVVRKWLKCSNTNPQRIASMWQLENAVNEGIFWTYSVRKKVMGVAVQEYGLKKCKERMRNKTTLKWYESKTKPRSECVDFFEKRTNRFSTTYSTYTLYFTLFFNIFKKI